MVNNLLGTIKEKLRPELPVQEKILAREAQFNAEDPTRQQWVLNRVRLYTGDLEALQLQIKGPTLMAYYDHPPGTNGPCKKVVVSVPLGSDRAQAQQELEKKLKLDLFSRGSNMGVNHRVYEEKGILYAEAIPATLTQGI